MKNLDFLKTNLIAHRGVHDDKVLENTIEAFELALKNKYIIELDVHLLKDNNIVVFHDDNLKRLTNKDINIKDLTLDELNNIKLLNGSKIPTLTEVLKLVNGKVPIIIELKYDNKVGKLESELVKILDNYKGKFVVKSFSPFSIMWFRKNRPNYIRGLLLSDKSKYKKWYKIMYMCTRPDFLSCNYRINIDKINKRNIPVLCWTIKTKEQFEKYKSKFSNLICENIINNGGINEVRKYKNSK